MKEGFTHNFFHCRDRGNATGCCASQQPVKSYGFDLSYGGARLCRDVNRFRVRRSLTLPFVDIVPLKARQRGVKNVKQKIRVGLGDA
jgi:hypothetical protein